MTVLYLSLSIVATTMQSVFKKKVNAKCTGCQFLIGTCITFFALVYFSVVSDLSYIPSGMLSYCLALSVCFAIATVTCVMAIDCGSMALTNLVLAYSRAIPILYSIFFLGDKLNCFQATGLLCLCLSMIFTYYKRDGGGISLKWVIYAVLLFLSNGMCAVTMRSQQVKFGTETDGVFMVISLIFATLILLVAAIIRERREFKTVLRYGVGWCGLCGASNGIANYFGLICLARLPGVVYYPVTAAGDLILTFVFSVALFREKFSKNQIVGFIFGVLSMILINI